ncbi:MAG TPA: NfeD family protein [Pirellulaceae bacterium]|jgi:membrane-bound ClpP family serine protease|nr:NfeD family protein [Pirellulaceae bacterium]
MALLSSRPRGTATAGDGKRLAFFATVGFCLALATASHALGAEEDRPPADKAAVVDSAAVRLVRVPLPLRDQRDDQVLRGLRRAVDDLQENAGVARPIIVLKFEPVEGEEASLSEFERSMAIARELLSPRYGSVRIVGWMPQGVSGHAVLPALASETWRFGSDASIGRAAVGEEPFDPLVWENYRRINERRRMVPEAMLRSMLDPAPGLVRLELADGVEHLSVADADRRSQEVFVERRELLAAPGSVAEMRGVELQRRDGVAASPADDLASLAASLEVSPEAFLEAAGPPETGVDARIVIEGPIHARSAGWVAGALTAAPGGESLRVVVLEFDTPGGDATVSQQIAETLASLDPAKTRTVAWIREEALGDAALIALACDEILMHPEAVLGGPGAESLSPRRRDQILLTAGELAAKKGREPSVAQALIDGQVELKRYTNSRTAAVRYLTDAAHAALDDSDLWQPGEAIALTNGLTLAEGVDRGWIVGEAQEFAAVADRYGMEGRPLDLRPNWAHTGVERFARFLSTPWVARLLLFVGFMALMSELSSPGLGAPAFLSAMCFLAFFWSQFLNGTAGWLEALLFGAGMSFILLEIFVTPGVGLFGIGGGIMTVASVILASQTFVLPGNEYQWGRVPESLSYLGSGMLGLVAAAVAFRYFLPYTPFFRRLVLVPPEPDSEQGAESGASRYAYLVGETGVTLSPLVPSGKAELAGREFSVLSRDGYVEAGAAVRVTQVSGTRISVETVDESFLDDDQYA